MAYAILKDITDRHGEAVLDRVTDIQGSYNQALTTVDEALDDATEEIDTYLSARYPLPLPTVPPIVKRLCVDIAVYHLSGDLVTEQQETRYNNAVKLLKAIAKGDASLGLPKTDEPASTDGMLVSAPAKTFGGGALDSY
jgi:phage gp36-like protein